MDLSVKFNTLCRLCASEESVRIDIFSDQGRKRQLLKKIEACLPFKINENDSLPKYVCCKCVYNLENWYIFRCRCIQAAYRLDQICNQLKDIRKQKSLDRVHRIQPEVSIFAIPSTNAASQKSNAKPLQISPVPLPAQTDVKHSNTRYADDRKPNPLDFLEVCASSSNVHGSNSVSRSQEKNTQEWKVRNVSQPTYDYPNMTQESLQPNDAGRRKNATPRKINADQRNNNDSPMISNYEPSQFAISKINLTKKVTAAVPLQATIIANIPQTTIMTNMPRTTIMANTPQTTIVASMPQITMMASMPQTTIMASMPQTTIMASMPQTTISGTMPSLVSAIPAFLTISVANEVEPGVKIKEEPRNDEDYYANEQAGNAQMINTQTDEMESCDEPIRYPDVDQLNFQSKTQPKPTNEEIRDYEEKADRRLFPCVLCDKAYSTKSSLNRHFAMAHGLDQRDPNRGGPNSAQQLMYQQDVQCEEEGDDFLVENMMESETVYQCEVCSRAFLDRASLWLHMVHAHREEAALSCGICLKVCDGNIALIEHVNTMHSIDEAVVQRRYSCQVCGRQHDSRQKLLKHATLHNLIDNQGQTIHPEEMIQLNDAFTPRDCKICRRKFFSEEKLNQHVATSHNNSGSVAVAGPTVATQFSCELCNSAHASRIDRWCHMYSAHANDERVVCPVEECRKIFISESLMTDHLRYHHEAQGLYTFCCEVCGKLWENTMLFYKHMMSVHPQCLPMVCGVCMKVFQSVEQLRAHVGQKHAMDDGSMGSRCDICGRPYVEKAKMLRHRKIHNVEDDYPVNISFKKKDDLICTLCLDGVAFSDEKAISDHRRDIHQLAVCDLCPKFYNGTNHLWKHVSKIHKGDPTVTCDVCDKTSATNAHLERHKIKYHAHLTLKEKQTEIACETVSSPATQVPVEHKCEACGKVFRIPSLLNRHAKTCRGPQTKAVPASGSYPCLKCSKVFTQEYALSKHMRYSHVLYYCEICEDKLFESMGAPEDEEDSIESEGSSVENEANPRGNVVDSVGNEVNSEGNEVNSEGNEVNSEGNEVNSEGNEANFANKVANSIENEANLVGNKANSIENKADCVRNVPNLIENVNVANKVDNSIENVSDLVSKAMDSIEDPNIPRNVPEIKRENNEENMDESDTSFDRSGESTELVGYVSKRALMDHIRESHAGHPELACSVEGCGKILRMREDFRKHEMEHRRGYFSYVCDLCGDFMSNKKKLRKHLLIAHKDDSRFLCGICAIINVSVDALREHVAKEHKYALTRPFSCHLCGRSWTTACKAIEHIHKMHGSQFHPCKICWKIFTEEGELNEHLQNHPPLEERELPPKKIVSSQPKRVVKKRKVSHELEKLAAISGPSPIKTCEVDFDTDLPGGGKRLRKKFLCGACVKTFRSIHELNEHNFNYHPNAPILLDDSAEDPSKFHDESAQNLSNLRDNSAQARSNVTEDSAQDTSNLPDNSVQDTSTSRVISTPKSRSNRPSSGWAELCRISCGICRKVWNSKRQLWQHMVKSHTDGAQYCCGVCLKVCHNYDELFYHLDSQHSEIINNQGGNANQYICNICGHLYTSHIYFESHKKVHKNVPRIKLRKCEYCEKTFRSNIFYQQHANQHAKEKNKLENSSESCDIDKNPAQESGSLYIDGGSMEGVMEEGERKFDGGQFGEEKLLNGGQRVSFTNDVQSNCEPKPACINYEDMIEEEME